LFGSRSLPLLGAKNDGVFHQLCAVWLRYRPAQTVAAVFQQCTAILSSATGTAYLPATGPEEP